MSNISAIMNEPAVREVYPLTVALTEPDFHGVEALHADQYVGKIVSDGPFSQFNLFMTEFGKPFVIIFGRTTRLVARIQWAL